MSNLFTTIRLIDLINTDTQSIDDLYSIVNKNLKFIYDKKVYPVENENLWNDFIERLCDRYFNRYLSFDTYYTFSLKLKFVIENNRERYKKIWEASLKEINPLITFFEEESTNEDRTNNGTSHSSNENHYDNLNDSETQNNLENKTIDNSTQTNNHKTDDNRVVEGMSANPKSQSSLSAKMGEMKYIDTQRLQINKDDYTTTTTNGGTTTVKDTGTTKNTTNGSGNSNGLNDSNYEDKINAIITRTKSGFNGNQIEMIERFSKLVFDMNNAIIEDIDNEHLFMSTLC